MKTFLYLLILLASLLLVTRLNAQTNQNIKLPSGYGSMTADITTGNDMIFAYAPDGINVFNVADNSFIQKIPYDVSNITYGKFNPVYFDSRLMIRDQNLMVYNNETNHKYLFVLTPSLKLLIINTDNLNQRWLVSLKISKTGDEYLDNTLDSQNGRAILKYDESNKRFFILVGGRDPNPDNNCTGNFHERINIFAFYDIDYSVDPDNQMFFNLHFVRINTPPPVGIYGNQINNYVFFTKNNNNYFTAVRLGTIGANNNNTAIGYIDTYKITETDADSIENDHIDISCPGNGSYYKMGEMLLIPEIDKIVSLPYKFFVANVQNPVFCVIDYSNPENVSHQIIDSPSKKILSAVYLNQNNDLIIGYEPNNNDVIEGYENTNLAVFHYNSSNDLFNLLPSTTFDNDGSKSTSVLDYNASTFLTKLDNSTALISKKDGIAKIDYNGSAYNYTNNLLNWDAENNFFDKAVIAGNKVFICNYAANGIDIYNINQGTFNNSIRTGYPVYKVEANQTGSKLIFYNTLNTYKMGVYAYDVQSETAVNIDPGVNLEVAIGDCKYNKFTNEFLITEFHPDFAKIARVNADNFTITGEITIQGKQFAKEMYVSPDGYLYVCTNMDNSPNYNPSIAVLNAQNYNSITELTTTGFSTYNADFAYYAAHFTNNPFDTTVSVLLTVQEKKLLPYNSMSSNIYSGELTESETPPGKLIVIDKSNTIETDLNISNYPVNIICPYSISQNNNSQYTGKSYLIGKRFYEIDHTTPSTVTNDDTTGYDAPFIGITYDIADDMLFAVKETHADSCGENRSFEIWTITYENKILTFKKFNTDGMPHGGQIASIFYNKYNNKIYIYQKIDAEKLGISRVNLLWFSADNAVWDSTSLSIKSYFPDYDHTRDDSYYFINNNISPYIDPYQNKIYLPNGGHSNVSVVDYTADEALMLKPYDGNTQESFTWLSFPRTETPSSAVNDVLGGSNIVPNNYINNSQLENVPLDASGNTSVYNTYDFPDWQIGGVLPSINQTYGYKLTLLYNTDPQQSIQLFLHGHVLSPSTTVNLKASPKENWVGYWLYQEQNPFDAIDDDVLDELTEIKAQEWFCYKDWYMGQQNPQWICAVGKGINHPYLKYGDMVILTSNSTINNFQWQNGVQAEFTETRPEPESFQYNEKEDYTAYLIEIDTSNRPAEIGAFIGNTCIGATRVMEEDTLVLVRGYDKDTTGTVYFVQYFNSQKSSMPAITDYYVKNSFNTGWQKRVINAEERNNHYLISFREQKIVQPDKSGINPILNLHPNPAKDVLVVKYVSETAGSVTVALYNITGKTVLTTTINQPSGIHNLKLNTRSLKNGIYLLRLSTANQTGVKQIVINK